MIGNHSHDVACKVAGLPPQHEVVEAMVKLGDKQRHAGAPSAWRESDVHAQLGRKSRECRRLVGGIGASRNPFHPLEKNSALHIAMLIGVKNVAASGEYPSGNAGD
jgi:hypothetical protein